MVVGITGKYCAGKNRMASFMEAHGFQSIDVDRLGHQALETEKDRIRKRFTDAVIRGGRVDRRALGAIVFSDPSARKDLEAIVHPRMVRLVEQIIGPAPGTDFCINAAILYRMHLDRLCDLVLWVSAPAPVRLYRAIRRDRGGIRAAIARMRNQTDVVPPRAQHSGQDVDIMKVTNVCGEKRLDRVMNLIAERLRSE